MTTITSQVNMVILLPALFFYSLYKGIIDHTVVLGLFKSSLRYIKKLEMIYSFLVSSAIEF